MKTNIVKRNLFRIYCWSVVACLYWIYGMHFGAVLLAVFVLLCVE